MNKVLLIYPATEKLGWIRYFQLPPLSLQQLAVVTPENWEIRILDERQEKIPFEESFDLVGITAMTHQACRAYEIADVFKKQGTPVVLGGIHPTVMPDEALTHADSVVIGEAEDIWPELLSDLLNQKLKQKYQLPIPTDSHLYLPWKEKSVFNRRKYVTIQMLQVSRGCPYDCEFCVTSNYFGKSFRYRCPEDVLAELRSFSGKLTIFVDDNILGDPERAKPILKRMIGMGIKWGGQASLRFAEDQEMIGLVAKSGCIGIFLGVESIEGEFSSLSKVGSKSSAADLIRRIRDRGIVAEVSTIFGFDDHDESVFEKTVRFMEKAEVSIPTYHILTPYPGTSLFEKFDREGRLLHKDWSHFDHSQLVFKPKNMTSEQLVNGMKWANQESYKWSSIGKRVMKGPGKTTHLLYNILRRGGL